MFYRRSAQVAIQAAIHLALAPADRVVPVRDLAELTGVRATYLTKVLQILTRAGLLSSVRGPGGGVQLSRPAQEITLWQVLAAVEPVGEFERCLLGLRRCSEEKPCALHEAWAPVRERLVESFQSRTLWEVATHGDSGERSEQSGPAAGAREGSE